MWKILLRSKWKLLLWITLTFGLWDSWITRKLSAIFERQSLKCRIHSRTYSSHKFPPSRFNKCIYMNLIKLCTVKGFVQIFLLMRNWSPILQPLIFYLCTEQVLPKWYCASTWVAMPYDTFHRFNKCNYMNLMKLCTIKGFVQIFFC